MTEFPSFFPKSADAMNWRPRDIHATIAAEAVARRDEITTTPASADRAHIELLLIDMQADFCHPDGALFVGGRSGTGALADTYRVARFIYGNVGKISRITPTLDTHVAGQVFFTSFWVDAAGNEPAPFTVVTLADVKAGRFRPSRTALAAVPSYLSGYLAGYGEKQAAAWVLDQVKFYLDALEKGGRYSLILWPYHCLLGTDGHTLARPILDAATYHSMVRSAPLIPVTKGIEPWTESYSVFRNEVERDCKGIGLYNKGGQQLADRLTRADLVDAVIIGGQASSHCVLSSVDDLIAAQRDETFPSRVYILRDCMSAVVTRDADGAIIPALDFTEHADRALARWAEAGANIVESTVPMEEWPGMADILERNKAPSFAR